MIVLDAQTFSAGNLAHSESLTVALGALNSLLTGPDTPLDLIIQDLCSLPHLFEFIISVMLNGRALVHKILTRLTNPALVETSSAGLLLRRLSSLISTLSPHLLSADILHQMEQHKVYVTNALAVLALLYTSDFLTAIASEHGSRVSSRPFVWRRHEDNHTAIDTAPFHRLGARVPMNDGEASRMAHEITDRLRLILKSYLELLLEPSLARQLRDAYISTRDDKTPNQSTHRETQLTKVGLYFENADRFGEWRVTLGTPVEDKLRELARSNREKCVMIVRKIKELSNGKFSEENQRRLNSLPGVPIFEAKVKQDLRLVYQVDVVPDRDEMVQRQAIRIYGIYSHIQVRTWDTLGQHLAERGEEYCQHCAFRGEPIDPDGAIYRPASFEFGGLDRNTKPTPLALSSGDKGELHSLLVLDKYIAFSQGFLHSLIINRDVQHVFELTPFEHKIIECNTSCYVLGRSGTGKTTTMLFKMLGIQRAWEARVSGSDMPKPRQIFVAKSPMLVTKMKGYFMKLLDSLALERCSLKDLKEMQAQFTESGSTGAGRVDIPEKYSLLEEHHFPLFVTFEKLTRMIAADVLCADDPETRWAAKFFFNTDEIEAEDSFVTYKVFAWSYWPHFPRSLTKSLEPWLVFSEFMGVIKGSEKSLAFPEGFLDEATYCSLSSRTNPTFANQRKTLYALFEAYCKLKRRRCQHDVADRTHAVLKALLGGAPLRGERVEYLYADEVQDILLVDALLLRLICQNPEGLFWAGDSAQTISAGSSFRFDDLKAFLYRMERGQCTHLIQDRSVSEPVMFQLAINYRSHGGIVNCAHSVIERITHFWPDAIDCIRPEQGVIDGLKPLFFQAWDQDTFWKSRAEFGARQCILVRDERAVKKLQEEVGKIGVIMSLYNSKGLEFDDVLLYNFFKDSEIDPLRWSVLLNHMEGEVDEKELAKVHVPHFGRDDSRFTGICAELKSLYVGITRAKKNLWIFDQSEKSDAMRMIWTARNQVENCSPGTDGIPRIAICSTQDEWETAGHNYFRHEKYPEAIHCFARASLPHMVTISKAFHLREVARAKVGVALPKAQQEAFLAAADAFATIARNDAPSDNDKLLFYRNAAGCYVRAGDDRKAAVGYLAAQEYELAARRFGEARLFDKMLEVLHTYPQKIPPDSLEELYTVCRLFYCSKQDGSRTRFPLFPSFEDELKFLKQHNFDLARAKLLETHERYLEAAEVHLSGNRPIDAIKNFLKGKESRNVIKRATKVLLDSLWDRCSFATPPSRVAADLEVARLLNLARQFPVNFLDQLDQKEISMFKAIACADFSSLQELPDMFIRGNREMAALLAFDHLFSRLQALKSFKIQEVSPFLLKFLEYIRLLRFIISHRDPLSDTSIMKLFCIEKVSHTKYSPKPRSALDDSATGDLGGSKHLHPSSKSDMTSALRKFLARHLCKRVTAENELCCAAPVFSECLTYIIGHCDRTDCSQGHVELADLDSKRYNVRIGIHLQQIRILRLMHSVNPRHNKHSDILGWLMRLYDAFHPQLHVQGSIADFDLSLIPGGREGMGVMKLWVQEALHNLYSDHLNFLTIVLKLTNLLFVFDHTSALRCINRACFDAPHVKMDDIISFFDGTKKTCISAGLRFLIHVLKSLQAVDLFVFCDCLEKVIGKICISCRLSSSLPLDGLVLPRGWLALNEDYSGEKDVDNDLTIALLDRVQSLLVCLQANTASKIFRLSNAKLTAVLTARICRALCFLTYNAQDFRVKRKVTNILAALRTAGPAHLLYQKYVDVDACDDDNEYLKAVVTYDAEAGVVIEDLVQLLHEQRDPQRTPQLGLPRIKHIYFTDPSKIPSLVAPQFAKLRPVPVVVPRAGDVPQHEKANEGKAHQRESAVDLAGEAHQEQEPQEVVQSLDDPTLIREHAPTEEEISAAKKILAIWMYYKHRNSRALAIESGLKAHRNTVFISCLKKVYASSWGKDPYRTLYLWALPRLIACLDEAITIAQKTKGKINKLLLKESHKRLEELGEQTTRMNKLLKDGRELRKKIDPDAIMHQKRDGTAMKEVVLKVREIINSLPTSSADIQQELADIQQEFQPAYELVMGKKKRLLV